MTEPLWEYPSDPAYQPGRRNWLLRFLGVQDKYDAIIATALLDASEDAAAGIRQRIGDERIGASARRYQLQLARTETRNVIRLLFRSLHDTIAEGQSAAAVAALEAGFKDDARVLRRLFPDPRVRGQYEDSLRQSASRGVQAMMTRILESNIPLSRRVYHSGALASGWVDRVINSSLARGDSAADMAARVRDSIRPDTPGGVAYAAKRLARTEINNAFHAQSINDAITKPWVDNVQWRLSKVHVPQGCRCETYAKVKSFPKEYVPRKPHPHCMCYIVPKLMEWEEFESNLVAGNFNLYIDNHL